MTPQELKSSILQYALQGRLVPQLSRTNVVSEVIASIRNNNAIKSKKAKACVDDNSIEKPFDIPDSWAWITLGELCNIVNGFTPSRTNAAFWENPTIAWFTVEDIHLQGRRIKTTKQAINRCALSSNTDRIVPPGTVLLCCTASVGEYAIAEIPLTTNQQFNGLVIKDEYSGIFSSEFLFSIAPSFKDRLLNVAGKTTFNFISVKKVSEMLIPVPPLEEQKRIVAKLEEILPLIDRYEAAWNKLEEFNKHFPGDMQKSILQLGIQGKLVEQRSEEGTGEELFQQIQVEKQALIKAGKIKKEKPLDEIKEDEIPFDIPETWKWVRLRSLGVFSSGKTPTMGIVENWDNGTVSWITSKDMKKKYLSSSEMLITEKAASEMKVYPENTVLMVVRSGILKRLLPVAILTGESTINQDVKALSLHMPGISEFVYVILKGMETHILKEYRKQVTTVDSLRFEDFQNMPVPLPPLAEQNRIVAKLEEILPLCERLK